ncbi:MAG: tRNA pseudouridine(38-40) synthase TruA [Gallicola sp.]|nr:tRNA pseudouridine(38-40) synthase TruA [Gallicola sp.]
MRNIKLTIQYDGSYFYGWQYQKNLPSVQGSIMDALEKLFLEEVKLMGAGRTDVGVHAMAQVAHFKTRKDHELYHIVSGLNHYLPVGVQITKAEEMEEDFHSRFSAKSKTYRYYLRRERYLHPMYRNYRGHVYGVFDVDKMRQAAEILLGTHDFSSFQTQKEEKVNPVRTLDVLTIQEEGNEVVFEFQGESFLHNMVRNIVGSLIEVGRGRKEREWIEEVLEKKHRKYAGPTVKAGGLYLWEIKY